MIRLASPVRHFMRTATDDTEIAGQPIKKGDWLMLHYTAANLDPQALRRTRSEFDVTRANANKQIAFGFGIHFCLGAQLARRSCARCSATSCPASPAPSWPAAKRPSKAIFVSGYKSLPLRYTLQ